jgi:hypothetical protein
MAIAHDHNLHGGPAPDVRPYGLRITLRPGDPFRRLLGDDWRKEHWFATARERDAALVDMARKHEFNRPGDRPALAFEKIERLAQSMAQRRTA